MEVYDSNNALIGVITDYTNARNEFIAVVYEGGGALRCTTILYWWGEDHILLKSRRTTLRSFYKREAVAEWPPPVSINLNLTYEKTIRFNK